LEKAIAVAHHVFAAAIDANSAETVPDSWGSWEWLSNLENSPMTDPTTGRTVSLTQAVHELLVRAAIQGQAFFAAHRLPRLVRVRIWRGTVLGWHELCRATTERRLGPAGRVFASSRLGLLNSTLYGLALSGRAYGYPSAPLHAIAYGDNWFYYGRNGYIPATRLGTLGVANFAGSGRGQF
jgi:hypothetical protein